MQWLDDFHPFREGLLGHWALLRLVQRFAGCLAGFMCSGRLAYKSALSVSTPTAQPGNMRYITGNQACGKRPCLSGSYPRKSVRDPRQQGTSLPSKSVISRCTLSLGRNTRAGCRVQAPKHESFQISLCTFDFVRRFCLKDEGVRCKCKLPQERSCTSYFAP